MSTVLRQRSSRLAGVVLMAAVSVGGVTGVQAASLMPAQAPTVGVRALDGSPGQDPFEAEVLRLTNEARAHARSCGGKRMKAAKPLRWSDQLAASAHDHSADMATQDYFSHYSQSGTSPFQRIRSVGYSYRAAGENIAAGRSLADPAAVVQAWLDSPGHCKVIMNRKYRELGVGRVEGAGKWSVYWTQNFGVRR